LNNKNYIIGLSRFFKCLGQAWPNTRISNSNIVQAFISQPIYWDLPALTVIFKKKPHQLHVLIYPEHQNVCNVLNLHASSMNADILLHLRTAIYMVH